MTPADNTTTVDQVPFEARPMSVRTFAEAAECSTRHVHRLIERGDLEVRRLGKRIVIPASEVARHLA